MKLSKQQETEIIQTYKVYFDSYIDGDVKTVVSLLDESYIQIGSAETEVFFNKKDAVKFLHDTIDQVAGKTEMRNRIIKVDPINDLILVTDLFDMYALMDSVWSFYAKFRASTLLQKKEDGWKFIHQHSSMPDTRTEEGENIAIDKVNAENLQLREAVKRRTVELEQKNRVLEVEAALERIRAQVTAMKDSSDLLDIVVTMNREFNTLGHEAHYFWHMRWLPDKYKKTMTSGDGSRIGMVMELARGFHENTAMLEWEQNTEPLLVVALGVEGAIDYVDKMIRMGRFSEIDHNAPGPDDLRAMGGLTFVMARTTHGEIGYTLPGVVTNPPEEDLSALVRFAGVFDLAYRRFEDLKNAERRNRETQIELALERVRSKTMAMHNSDDVGDTVVTLFHEVLNLDLDKDIRCGIGILEGTELMETRSATLYPNGELNFKMGMLDMTIHPLLIKIKEAWKSDKTRFTDQMSGTDVFRYYTALNNEPDYPFYIDLDTLPEIEYHNSFSFREGILFAFSPNPMSDEAAKVLDKFARVFGQTYTRYLDLEKAEAQAWEAQIEAGLERVRSRTLAMQKSDELPQTAVVVFKQLINLGIAPNRLYIGIINDEDGTIDFWVSDEDGNQVSEQFTGARNKNTTISKMYDGWIKKKKSITINIKGKDLENYFHYLNVELKLPFKQGQDQNRRVQNLSYFSNGFIGTASHEDQPEETSKLLERFAAVFNLTFARFHDLQVSEAQTREALIEGSLERVRARALAMQKPEELQDVAQVLRHEMGLLGVEELETSSIYIKDDDTSNAECWYALKDVRPSEKSLVSDHFTLDLNDTWVGREMLKFYNSANEQTSIVMTGIERKAWINYCEELSVPFRGYYGDVIPDRTYHLCKFTNGAIGAATPGDFSDENWGLLKRVSSVFSLAYSRFQDLTQARHDLALLLEEKKRTEDALTNLKATQTQLIHAEKMASLGELTAGIAHEIQNPLNFVNNFSDVSVDLVGEMNEEIELGNSEDVIAIAADLKQNLELINHHGQRASFIVKGMLEHSRTTTGEKRPTDINVMAEEFLKLSFHGLRAKDKSFNAEFKTVFDKESPFINVVAQDIGRVMLNLINNAFYAVAEKRKQQPEDYNPLVTVITEKKGDQVEIKIIDNGNGIPEDVKNKIFQPFFTTKPTGEGTGLGLSLSYDIITKGHGGTLEVETTEGIGTEFIIKLMI